MLAGVTFAIGRYAYALMRVLRAARQEAGALGMATLCGHIDALAAQITEGTLRLPCGLTVREVEVFRLAAMGRNNRDIAAVLAISTHTVANHMRSVLQKTYAANRIEAAAFSRTQGPTAG